MSKEQMQKDLRNNFRQKLRTLVCDTIDIHHRGGISTTEFIAATVTELIDTAISMLVDSTHITPKTFGEMMEKTFAAASAAAGKKHEGKEKVYILEIELLNPHVNPEVFGIIPEFLNPDDPRPAREQFNERYAHGGGWCPSKGWQLLKDDSIYYTQSVEEGEDPRHSPLARFKFRNESIVLYDHAWVAIIQPDRTFEVSRMD
jgi:hypothetical protein